MRLCQGIHVIFLPSSHCMLTWMTGGASVPDSTGGCGAGGRDGGSQTPAARSAVSQAGGCGGGGGWGGGGAGAEGESVTAARQGGGGGRGGGGGKVWWVQGECARGGLRARRRLRVVAPTVERKGKEGLPSARTRGLLAYWRGPISEDARRLLGRGSPHLRGR